MSATFSVVVLCPNGRRETVKVSPNSSILKVLEEACLRQNINSEDFELRHYNRPLDLSLPIRFSNLSNNALLEMKAVQNARKEGMVVVCVQMESGERFMKEFHPSTSINDVLLHCLSSDSTTLLLKGEPVCIYMRQKIMGKGLHTTTLRDLGLTKGQAILRLLYRKPEDIQEQAHVSNPLQAAMISDPEKSDQNLKSEQIISKDSRKPETIESCATPLEKKICLVKSVEDSSMETDDNSNVAFKDKISPDPPIMNSLSAVKKQNSPNRENTIDNICDTFGNAEKEINQSITAMDCDSKSEEDFFEGVDDIKYVGESHAVLYSLDDITDNKKADLPDEFFELTIRDAKYLMEEYKRQRKEFENQPLLTKELRERQILQNLSRYSQTVIRVYFPDRVVLQAVFSAIDTVQSVLDFVHHYLEDKSLTYYLYTTPPKEKLKLENRLIECLLIPAAVVYLGCDVICTKYLLNDYKDKLSDPRAAALAASEARKKKLTAPVDIPSVTSKVSTENKVSENMNSSESACSSIQNAPPKEKVPKWLKIRK